MNVLLDYFSDDFFYFGFLISSFSLSTIYSQGFPPHLIKYIRKDSLEISIL